MNGCGLYCWACIRWCRLCMRSGKPSPKCIQLSLSIPLADFRFRLLYALSNSAGVIWCSKLLNRSERSCFATVCRWASPDNLPSTLCVVVRFGIAHHFLSLNAFAPPAPPCVYVYSLCSPASSLLCVYLTPWQREYSVFALPTSLNLTSIGTVQITARASRVSLKRHQYMHQVSDSGEQVKSLAVNATWPYCLPVQPTRSAFSILFSELNTEPASSPVNA